MKKGLKILIADRNPHVRKFLKREMTTEGYEVQLAENGRQVFKLIQNSEPIDLLILDPDLSDADESSLLKTLRDRMPDLPIIIHTFLSDYVKQSSVLIDTIFVEKKATSVERLKQVVFGILKKSDS